MAIDAVAEEVAANLEEAAQATRKLSTAGVPYLLGGLLIGAGIGFYFGRRYLREQVKAEAFRESELEVLKLREYYERKNKPDLQQVVEEQGYELPDRPLKPVVPVFEQGVRVGETEDSTLDGWDYEVEVASRTPDHPYVIHINERYEKPGYSQVTFTYYAGDDVLCDTDDRPIPHADLIVGQSNLKFGHGSDDNRVVFVRNEEREMEMEICLHDGSYEEEVLGLDRNAET